MARLGRPYVSESDRDAIGADRPRTASRKAIAARLNRLAIALDYAHEELAELRHELGVAERLEVQRRKLNPERGR